MCVGSGVFTSSENVKTDDTEVKANEQMIRSVGAEKRGRERKFFFFFQCQMEEQLAPLVITVGIDFPLTRPHTHTITQTNTHSHAEIPPASPNHLPGTWSSKRDQGRLSSLAEGEGIRASEEAVERHLTFCSFLIISFTEIGFPPSQHVGRRVRLCHTLATESRCARVKLNVTQTGEVAPPFDPTGAAEGHTLTNTCQTKLSGTTKDRFMVSLDVGQGVNPEGLTLYRDGTMDRNTAELDGFKEFQSIRCMIV